MDSKILLLDIETAPNLGWVWGKWEQNVIDFEKSWYILSFAAKWLDTDRVYAMGLVDFPGYKNDRESDYALCVQLHKLLDEADIVIAHNGDRFDIPKINTRFLTHGFVPPTPYKTVDTLKIAKQTFKFDSNKLDELGRYLKIGRKMPHTGFDLWKRCMLGDEEAWKTMLDYNRQDILLLEQVYYKMRPWYKNHANVNRGDAERCPKCGAREVQKRGFSFTLLRKKQRYQCLKCSGWFEGSAVKP